MLPGKSATPKKTLPRSIAISRECGVGGAEVAEEVARQLEWPLYGRDLVQQIAEDTGVRTQLLESIDERSPRWLAENFGCLSQRKNN